MFIGHYGVSLAAKRWAPRLSLGWLFLAVQLLDVLFMIFLVVGVEHMRLVPGFTAYNPYDLYDMPFTHSVVGAAIWAVVAGAMAAALRLPPVILGGAVFSHLLLDIPMHTRDLSLAGGATTRIGLGLWNHRGAALAAELVTLGAGAFLYARRLRPLRLRMWILLAVLVAIALATPFLPTPPSTKAFAVQGLVGYVALAAWAAWADRPAAR